MARSCGRPILIENFFRIATTFVAALANSEGKVWVRNIGDSRKYLIGEKPDTRKTRVFSRGLSILEKFPVIRHGTTPFKP
jgi:hypothetical protein